MQNLRRICYGFASNFKMTIPNLHLVSPYMSTEKKEQSLTTALQLTWLLLSDLPLRRFPAFGLSRA